MHVRQITCDQQNNWSALLQGFAKATTFVFVQQVGRRDMYQDKLV